MKTKVRGHCVQLAVLFRSVVVESQFKDIGAIGNAGSSAELEGFRKPAHMIGWDILPRMMSAGIFRDTRLVVRGPERIRDFFCAQIAFDPEQRSARYLLDLRLEGAFARLDTSRLNVTVSRKGGVVARTGVNVVDWTPRLWFGLSNADLWWPRGWGEPALYDVKIEWCDRADGRVFAEKSFRLGVKKVEFELADFIDKDRPGEMKFIVEHCRVHKFAQKTGMTWWNVRDGWPNISDAVVDYYGRRKRAFEAIARAQRDVLVMVDEDHALRVVNDTLEPVAGHAVLTDAETGRVVFDGDFACDANAVATVGKLSLKGQGVVKIRYTTGGQTFDSHYLYGEPKFKFADYRRWMGL